MQKFRNSIPAARKYGEGQTHQYVGVLRQIAFRMSSHNVLNGRAGIKPQRSGHGEGVGLTRPVKRDYSWPSSATISVMGRNLTALADGYWFVYRELEAEC